jgi:hypothetical protein
MWMKTMIMLSISNVELTEFQVYIHKSALLALLLLHTTFYLSIVS